MNPSSNFGVVVLVTSLVSIVYYLFNYSALLNNQVSGVKWAGKVVFEDDFTGPDLDTKLWEYETGCDESCGVDTLVCFESGTNNIKLKNGSLVITAKIENKEDKNYTSGRLRQRQEFLYGAYVVRARLPSGKHLWPMIWMLKEVPGCRYEEILIMENRGQKQKQVQFTAYYGRTNKAVIELKGDIFTLPEDLSLGFHEYAILWTPEKIEWWVDDTKYDTLEIKDGGWTSDENKKPCGANQKPFSESNKLILNLGVGSKSFFPIEEYGQLTVAEAREWTKPTMEIDWVRIYQS